MEWCEHGFSQCSAVCVLSLCIFLFGIAFLVVQTTSELSNHVFFFFLNGWTRIMSFMLLRSGRDVQFCFFDFFCSFCCGELNNMCLGDMSSKLKARIWDMILARWGRRPRRRCTLHLLTLHLTCTKAGKRPMSNPSSRTTPRDLTGPFPKRTGVVWNRHRGIHNGRTIIVGRVGGRSGHICHSVAILIKATVSRILRWSR